MSDSFRLELEFLQTAKCQCLLTHAHPNAVMGAVLQVAAVYFALHYDKGTLQAYSFINKLVDVMKQQEPLIYKTARYNILKVCHSFTSFVNLTDRIRIMKSL